MQDGVDRNMGTMLNEKIAAHTVHGTAQAIADNVVALVSSAVRKEINLRNNIDTARIQEHLIALEAQMLDLNSDQEKAVAAIQQEYNGRLRELQKHHQERIAENATRTLMARGAIEYLTMDTHSRDPGGDYI